VQTTTIAENLAYYADSKHAISRQSGCSRHNHKLGSRLSSSVHVIIVVKGRTALLYESFTQLFCHSYNTAVLPLAAAFGVSDALVQQRQE